MIQDYSKESVCHSDPDQSLAIYLHFETVIALSPIPIDAKSEQPNSSCLSGANELCQIPGI